MKRYAGTALIVALLSGCGGGGGSDTTAVSASPPATGAAPSATSPPTPSTPSSPPAVNPPASPPPSTSPGPSPGTPSAPNPPAAPSVSGAAVIKALTTAVEKRASAAEQSDNYFSTVSQGYSYSTARFTSVSHLTAAGVPRPATEAIHENGQVSLSLVATTNGSTSFSLAGDGSVTTPQGQYGLTGEQYTIPATVPLDQTLYQFNLTSSPGSSVRFFVGSIDGQPDLMRVCWNIDAPGTLRVACSRNQRTTGAVAGVDAVNDVGGRLLNHVSTDTALKRWWPMLCLVESWGPQGTENSTRFELDSYDASKEYGGVVTLPWRYGITTQSYADKLTDITINNPQGYIKYTIRNGDTIVRRQTVANGGTGGATFNCSPY